MIKKTLFAALLMAAACPAFAQTAGQNADVTETVEYSTEKYKVETNSFWSNWFISVGAGGQVYFGDHDRQVKFGKRIAPSLDVAIGKWFTPGIGVRLMYNGLSVKGATQSGAYSTGEDVPGKGGAGYWLDNQKFKYANLQADVMFNLMNIFGGYKEKRVYSLSPYAGFGMMRVTDTPHSTEISGHFGLINTFRLCSALDLNLDIRGTVVSDHFDGESGGRTFYPFDFTGCYHRESFLEVGGFDNSFKNPFWQLLDFGARLLMFGKTIRLNPYFLVHYDTEIEPHRECFDSDYLLFVLKNQFVKKKKDRFYIPYFSIIRYFVRSSGRDWGQIITECRCALKMVEEYQSMYKMTLAEGVAAWGSVPK